MPQPRTNRPRGRGASPDAAGGRCVCCLPARGVGCRLITPNALVPRPSFFATRRHEPVLLANGDWAAAANRHSACPSRAGTPPERTLRSSCDLWVVFFSREIGWNFKKPTGLSIYLSKKRAPCLSAYLSISPKNGRLTFFWFSVVFYFPKEKMACSAWFHFGG